MDFDSLPFIPGLELSACFYWEGVRPVLDEHFPQIRHAAARLDQGSDVLGFDTPQSRDHGWGPKITLFLSKEDYAGTKEPISEILADELPLEICGYPTNYDVPFSDEAGLVPIDDGPVNHWVDITTVKAFFMNYLGVDPGNGLKPYDWLTFPQQRLRTIACGKVFHDDLGELTEIRNQLGWYPHDLWLYLLANQWRRIDQEEPFMARCGDAGDELGSRLIAARMVIEVMRLCFLMARQYTPYAKWFGTAFQLLPSAAAMNPIFHGILNSQNWRERECHLSKAYLHLMAAHNALRLTAEIKSEISPFFNRPYQIPHAARFVDALHGAIQSEMVRSLPRNIGGLDQFVHSTDILSNPPEWMKFRRIYSFPL